MRAVFALIAAFTLALAPVAGLAAPPSAPVDTEAPAAGEVPLVQPDEPAQPVLLAQLDDRDIAQEETLEELQQEEFEKEAWSVGKAVGLSLLPGGGAGLIYAERPAAAVVPYLLSAVGYGLGLAYVLGVFDESSSQVCDHARDGRIDLEECGRGNNPDTQFDPDERATPVNGLKPPYRLTQGDYSRSTVGEDFDGKGTGLTIIAATWVVTTLLGAIWSGSAVAQHNDEVRKSIESTVQAPRPFVGYDGDQGVVGFQLNF